MARKIIPLQGKTVREQLLDMSDDDMLNFTFAVPWQFNTGTGYSGDYDRDSDGFTIRSIGGSKDELPLNRSTLQQKCWDKTIDNPQLNTNVRGVSGRLAGYGFGIHCENRQIQDAIDRIEKDYRNRLTIYYPKFVSRAHIEGELYLCLSVHEDGFIEVDFIEPNTVTGTADPDGILMHPDKPNLPLFYCITPPNIPNLINSARQEYLIPSIYVARNPDLVDVARQYTTFSMEKTAKSRSNNRKFREIGGFFRFIVAWDRSFITKRNVSHLRTTIKWLEYYENLKKYEIDHKKSAGAYLWVFKITDPKSFRIWLNMSDAQRRATGIAAKKTPGGSIVLPPGIEIEVLHPQLQKISDSDTDVLNMAISGLNESADVTMGSSNTTYGNIKASRGPMSDRISDEAWYWECFLRYELWSSIFFLMSKIGKFPNKFPVKEAVDFVTKKETVEVPDVPGTNGGFADISETSSKKEKDSTKDPSKNPAEQPIKTKKVVIEVNEPVFKTIQKSPEELIEINFPVSETIDIKERATALLGVKHGSINDVLGIPLRETAKRLGFGNYYRLRLQKATEEARYPELMANVDQESFQERSQSEPSPSKVRRAQKKPAGVKNGKE